ncbi:MAG: hypothetical protein QM831_01120 [Kofleriaceae bacterium]
MSGERFVAQLFYLPSGLYAEMDLFSEELSTDVATLTWAVWEAEKQQLHEQVPATETDTDPPAPYPGHNVVMPDTWPEGSVIATLADHGKVKVQLRMPQAIVAQLRAFATSRERSLSWVVRRAYLMTRSRLRAAMQ